MYCVLHIRAHPAEYDAVNAHAYDWPVFALSAPLPLPVLHTLHNAATSHAVVEALRAITEAGAPHIRLAAISRARAVSHAGIASVDTVLYNGLNVDAILFGVTAAEAHQPRAPVNRLRARGAARGGGRRRGSAVTLKARAV